MAKLSTRQNIKKNLFKYSKMTNSNKHKNLFKIDFIQEVFISLLGAFIFFLILLIVPKRLLFARGRSRDYPKIFLSIIILSFLFIFILFNQKSTKIKLLEINYKRNIILFSIFNFATQCVLFFFTKFGIYLFTSKNLKFFLIDSYSNFRPFYFFNYYFLFFFSLIPIILFEAWKKIYDEKISFFISVISSVFLLKPFYIDILIGILFIMPFILYYIENIKKKVFSKRDYIIGGILGAIILCCFYVIFLILLLYVLIRLILNYKELKENFKQVLIILGLTLFFSCWVLILLFINLIFVEQSINQEWNLKNFLIEFTYFAETSIISFSGVFLICGIIYIIKKYNVSRELRILGNFLLSFFIFFLIAFLGIVFNIYIFQFRFFPLFLYITIIASCIFYVRFFHLLNNGKIFRNYKFKGNFHQVEIFLLIFIFFSQAYFNLYNIYEAEYHESAVKRENPDNVIDTFYEYEYKEYFSLPLVRILELCLSFSINLWISIFYDFMKYNSNIAENLL